jgi:hypothetical protein
MTSILGGGIAHYSPQRWTLANRDRKLRDGRTLGVKFFAFSRSLSQRVQPIKTALPRSLAARVAALNEPMPRYPDRGRRCIVARGSIAESERGRLTRD